MKLCISARLCKRGRERGCGSVRGSYHLERNVCGKVCFGGGGGEHDVEACMRA